MISRIVALVEWEKRAADDSVLTSATRAMSGVQPTRTWCVRLPGAGLAACAHEPPSGEAFAVPGTVGGGVAVVADARLDNRPWLEGCLGLGTDVPDVEVILAAYARWGEASVERLLGDFAFALWDAGRQALVCARDPVGARPLLYARCGSRMAVASELRALTCVPWLPRKLDEEAARDHLLGTIDDPGATILSGVRRLLPGHLLTATPTGLGLRAFWRPEVRDELKLKDDAAYAEAFRASFVDAVRCRMGPGRTGSMLSGGLDSTSVTCVARDESAARGEGPLTAYSLRFPDVPKCDEGPFIEAVVKMGGSRTAGCEEIEAGRSRPSSA